MFLVGVDSTSSVASLVGRTLVSMLDLPETAWANALETHTMEARKCIYDEGSRGGKRHCDTQILKLPIGM